MDQPRRWVTPDPRAAALIQPLFWFGFVFVQLNRCLLISTRAVRGAREVKLDCVFTIMRES